MKNFKKVLVAALISFPLFAYAHGDEEEQLGKPGKDAKVSRTIEVTAMDTMKFSPEKIEVKKGETIKFVIINTGKLSHEFMLGDLNELKEHAEMMKKMPDMKHHDNNAVTVEPGKTESIIWEFTKAGKVGFACLIPGHSEAGMTGSIKIK